MILDDFIKEPVYYTYKRTVMAQFLPDYYSKVLEIGCGEGNFIHNLTNLYEKWGIEPVKHIAQKATKNFDKMLIDSY